MGKCSEKNDVDNTLLQNYGVLMTLKQLASILNRSENGLRQTLCRDTEVARVFANTKMKIGRRIYFKTEGVASALNRITSVETQQFGNGKPPALQGDIL
jgi:hypothetical protein